MALVPAHAAPPDLFAQPYYTIARPFWSWLGRTYRVFAPDGRLVLFVRLPLFRLREEIVLYADESEREPVLAVKSRRLASFKMCHDVLDPQSGVRLGSIRTRGLSFIWRDQWDILDPDDRVAGAMVEEGPAILRRIFRFLPGRHRIELGGAVVALVRQAFRFFVREFELTILPAEPAIEPRFAIACALLAARADARRESR